ncbi:TolC family protein [Aquifex pyrophilus]
MILLLILISLSFSIEISLEEAIKLALKNNRTLKKFERQVKSAVYERKLSVIERFSPKVDTRLSKDKMELVARILLLEFTKRLHNIQAQKERERIARITLEEFKNRLKIEVTKLYTSILIYDVYAQELREFMAVSYVRFDREREKLRLGLSDRVKVAEWERKYRYYRSKLLEIQRKYNETLYRLNRYLRINMEEDLNLKPLNFNVPKDKSFDEKELLKYVDNNYRLRIKKHEIAYYRELEKGSRRLFFPELVLEGKLGKDLENGENYTEMNAYLNIPLFDPSQRFRVKSLKEKINSLTREYEEMKEEVKEKVYTFPYLWDEYIGKYVYAKTNMRWAEENLELKRSQYELQLAFDLGYAMAYYTQAERILLESKVNILLFLMNVYHTLGMNPEKALRGNHFFLK